ncbi:MAG: helicase-related protein, partial [Limnothrix sp.]
AKQLDQDGLTTAAIHGNKTQAARARALKEFKQGKVKVLVATDVASRGLDIEQLPHVVNFELPNVPEDYVHRIGRTGRAGNEGQAISLVSHAEKPLLKDIEKLLNRQLDKSVLPGYEPTASGQVETDKRPNQRNSKPRRSRSNGNGQGTSKARPNRSAKPNVSGSSKPRQVRKKA